MKFTLIFFFSTLALFGSFYGFVVAVDPYNKLGYNPFGFETKAVDFARENKFNQIEHTSKTYDVFLLGSSAAHRYETKEINRLTGFKSYNYAVQSTTPEDYLAITRHILSRQKPKMIIISLDFYGLNKNYKTNDMFFSSPLKNYLDEMPVTKKSEGPINMDYLTIKALGDSFKVVWVNLAGEARHAYLEDGDHVHEPVEPGPLKITQFSYDNYEFDAQRINYLKEIKRLSEVYKFKLLVFTSPLSYGHIEKIESDPVLKEKLAEFKKLAVNVFGQVYDFNNDSLMAYNSKEFFRDSTHPTNLFSTMVLESMLGVASPTFGKLLVQVKGNAIATGK